MIEKNTAIQKILDLVELHANFRRRCLNLVSAENRMSPLAQSLLSTDLSQRYGDYTGRDLRARKYFGTRYIVELEAEIGKLAQDVFRAKYVELRSISGHIAGNCIMLALARPGDLIMELDGHAGGHRLATKLASSRLIELKVGYLPFDPDAFNIIVDQTLEMVRKRKPRMIILGASNFLFPVPLRDLVNGLHEFPETILVYDASHVLGLIAGDTFQDPLGEGADVVMGGTQKSFPGPQGAVIYSNREELINAISGVIYPAMESNHHLARLPALAVSLQEMKIWGHEYATQVIHNARVLAKALVDQGLSVVGEKYGYTNSHSVLINTRTLLGTNQELGQRLDDCGIIVTAIKLPQQSGGAGLRIGTNEITRLGAAEEDMPAIAKLIGDVLFERRPLSRTQKEVEELAYKFQEVRFTWSGLNGFIDAGSGVERRRQN